MQVVKSTIPAEIDYSLFKWLRPGDREQIAADVGKSVSMVRATLRGETFNGKIIEVALQKVIDRMTPVLEKQAQAQRIRNLIQKTAA